MHHKHRGAHNELLAVIWLLKQGYEVFRNVSQHGLVDIVAMKDGELHKFDVKGRAKDQSKINLSAEQIALDVKVLRVSSDGDCDIDWSPSPKWRNYMKNCLQCNQPMQSRLPSQLYCSQTCRPAYRALRQKTGGLTLGSSAALQ